MDPQYKRIVIFDTETTGLPTTRQRPTLDNLSCFPNIAQWSWITYDLEKHKFVEYDYIIKLPHIPIESTAIHGITTERSKKVGFSIELVIDLFKICIEHADLIIAHNFEFDWNVILAECMRHNIPIQYKGLTYCTMKTTTKLCNLPNMKWPTLKELHHVLFQEDPKDLHNAIIDVLVCWRCYIKIKHNKDICIEHKSLKKRF
jgi:DNA polymerase III epsilon subunit-like protein